jgi:lipopolysaccharide export LptBFGC system permease protein LptF
MTENVRRAGRHLRGFAERTFDRETVENVILPALADLQHESAGSDGGTVRRFARSIRAYWGFWKTMGMCAIGDVAHNKDRISTSLGGRTLIFLSIVVALLMLENASWMLSFGPTHGTGSTITAGALLLPSTIVLALPAAFFFAVAMFRPSAGIPSTRLRPSAVVGSIACAGITFALMMAIVPTTNQAYREHVFEAIKRTDVNAARGPLRKGFNEMTLPELNEHIRHASSSRQADLARANRDQRFAFVGTVFVLALLGLALAGRWRSRVATLVAALAIFVTFSVCFGFGASLNTYGYPAAYGAWTANGAFLVFALRLLRNAEG